MGVYCKCRMTSTPAPSAAGIRAVSSILSPTNGASIRNGQNPGMTYVSAVLRPFSLASPDLYARKSQEPPHPDGPRASLPSDISQNTFPIPIAGPDKSPVDLTTRSQPDHKLLLPFNPATLYPLRAALRRIPAVGVPRQSQHTTIRHRPIQRQDRCREQLPYSPRRRKKRAPTFHLLTSLTSKHVNHIAHLTRSTQNRY